MKCKSTIQIDEFTRKLRQGHLAEPSVYIHRTPRRGVPLVAIIESTQLGANGVQRAAPLHHFTNESLWKRKVLNRQ